MLSIIATLTSKYRAVCEIFIAVHGTVPSDRLRVLAINVRK